MSELSSHPSFPQGLLSWASHREGGVRRAFVQGGRPTDEVISTPVVERLSEWICQAVDGATSVRGVLLVGGPGNGKTDAVEQTIEALGRHLRAPDDLRARFVEALSANEGSFPPRILKVHLGDLLISTAEGLPTDLHLVQDASVPGSNGESPEAALANELSAVQARQDVLYLCCLNRGILADAIASSPVGNSHSAIKEILRGISASVAQGGIPRECFPLAGTEWLAAWPMDAESLLEGPNPPAKRIFELALDEKRWSSCDACEVRPLCPFRANRDALAEGAERLGNLLLVLRRFEVASSKRWSFRDLLSLVPELLVGNEQDFVTSGKSIDPCNWVRRQVAAVESSATSRQQEGWRAALRLSSRLYQHALFPAWPTLRSTRKLMHAATKASESSESNAPRAVFNWLSAKKRGDETQVRRLLYRAVSPALDPALAAPDIELTAHCRVRDIDVAFSRGVVEGTKRLAPLQDLHDVDRLALDVLAKAEAAMDAAYVPHRRLGDARRVQRLLRQLACRYAKRTVLVRRGATRDHHLFDEYAKASVDEIALHEVRKAFGELLNSGTHFRAPLIQSLGQPRRAARRDAILVTSRVRTSCQTLSTLNAPTKAPTATPFLLVDEGAKKHPVAMTFQLFRALTLLRRGAYRGCLPPDVTALIQGLESRVSGRRVRDAESLLDDDVLIELFGGELKVDLVADGTFRVYGGEP